jgi:hypothetical protein
VLTTSYPPAAKGPAIPVSEAQFLKVENAAQWLCPADRDQFFAAVADELRGRELDDGLVTRSICTAFKKFYRPIQISEAPRPRAYFKRVV